jgi:thiol-disulfide isomerase/thioredoxin
MKTVIALLTLLCLSMPAAAGGLDPLEGFQAPAISLADPGGNTHTLSDYRGKVVLINFWASWCGPCVTEMPAMQRLQKALADKPFTILAINVRESRAKVWKFASTLGLKFPLLLDQDGSVADAWRIDVYPTSFLVDPEGRLQYVAYGPREWDSPAMIDAIEKLIDGPKLAAID